MKGKRVMLAAPGSGSGKTTLTCALLQVLKSRGENVIAFKCGPDYIDPMFHEQVIGVPSQNLDTFFTGEEETKRLFWEEICGTKTEKTAVLEGVMGLFDGMGGVSEEGSSYHLAKVTGTPIILVIDGKGMGRSIVPLIAGFLAYDKEKLIKGVILNRMSKGYYDRIKPIIEEELGIAVLGYYPEQKQLQVASRHLGLVLPHELAEMREWLEKSAELLEQTVSIEAIMDVAGSAKESEGAEVVEADGTETVETAETAESDFVEIAESDFTKAEIGTSAPVIAVARDEAFCFYYAENLRLLKKFGAKLVYFSPLRDEELPEECDALILGGGYPEVYAERLCANKKMLQAIKRAADNHMPIIAECGGFMYLHEAITDESGKEYPMAGVLPGHCHYTGKLVRFGYIELREKESVFLPEGESIKGHEFHYFDSTDNGADCLVRKPGTGKEYSAVIERENCFLGFPHLYYASNPEFAKRFVEIVRAHRKENEMSRKQVSK